MNPLIIVKYSESLEWKLANILRVYFLYLEIKINQNLFTYNQSHIKP